ncbi:unnamed protein product [Meloidogyne enterolobii]|uniref:Uncharacterized protein n=1 Tax=Meloidogyne enterolobii TaxID=390850 RepID=A0ACB1AFH4_MELEN
MAKFFFVFLLFFFIFINSSYCEDNDYYGPWKVHSPKEIKNKRDKKAENDKWWDKKIKENANGKTRRDYDFSQNKNQQSSSGK